jgi:hypothetical protein
LKLGGRSASRSLLSEFVFELLEGLGLAAHPDGSSDRRDVREGEIFVRAPLRGDPCHEVDLLGVPMERFLKPVTDAREEVENLG